MSPQELVKVDLFVDTFISVGLTSSASPLSNVQPEKDKALDPTTANNPPLCCVLND
jgi:hypothetical protein